MSFLSVRAFLSELFYIIVVVLSAELSNVPEYQMKTTTFSEHSGVVFQLS